MARLLCVVQDTFAIQGRGLVFVPGIVPEAGETFRVGDVLRFRSPDGRVVDRRIDSLEIPLGALPRPDGEVELIVLMKDLSKADLPIGTEVYSIDAETATPEQ